MLGIDLLDDIPMHDPMPLVLYAGDNLPDVKPGLWIDFTTCPGLHPHFVDVRSNTGGDTIVIFENGSATVRRRPDEPGLDALPLRLGGAESLLAGSA